MTRVMIAVDGSELDEPLARTAQRLFGADADYWAVNVQGDGANAFGAVSTTFPAMYGGSLVGFGTASPYLAPDPHQVRGTAGDAGTGIEDHLGERADATAEAAVDEAGISDAGVVAELGDHDRSWWSGLFAPAVGSELIDRAEIPVLVVSRDAADR